MCGGNLDWMRLGETTTGGLPNLLIFKRGDERMDGNQ